MPIKTDEPCEPAGQVPIAGLSSAKAKRGSAAAAASAPPARNSERRVGVMSVVGYIEPPFLLMGDWRRRARRLASSSVRAARDCLAHGGGHDSPTRCRVPGQLRV